MFDAVGHGVSAGAAQGEVQHHDLIGSNESSNTHDKDQVPAVGRTSDKIWVGQDTQTVWVKKKDRRPAEIGRGQQRTRWLTCQLEGRRETSQGLSEQ